jgi:hypothetical protein
MGKLEFDPEVTEEQWLAGADIWAMWRSLPWMDGYNGHQRKRLLLTVAIVRRVEELMLDPRSRAVLSVAEAYADGAATGDAIATAHRAAYEAEDQAFPTQAAEFEANAARKVWNCWSDLGEAAGAAIAAGAQPKAIQAEKQEAIHLIHDVFGNPFRPVEFDSKWRSSAVTSLAQSTYDNRDFAAMPVLADALAESGCDNSTIVEHCRNGRPHVRGCWVVDLVLGKE